MSKQYKLRGINDDHNTCEVCGKTNLKKVMWLSEIAEDGNILDPFAAGTTCGSRMLGIGSGLGKARISAKVQEFARKQISQAQQKFVDENCVIRSGNYIPRDMLAIRYSEGMTIGEFLKLRNEKYPILNMALPLDELIKHA